MKKLYKGIRKIKFILIITFTLFCPIVMSKDSPEMRVDYVIGKAFLKNANGDISEIKKGDHIYHLSEINTEEGSLVGVSNFYDQQFSLSGSGYIKIFKNNIELRAGYLWIESVTVKNDKFHIETPNAKITYEKGISILSYDQYSQKTQILTTQGRFEFKNIFEEHLSIWVQTGEFSFISKDYENGMPRKATPAGQSTFLKITGLFKARPVETRFDSKDSSYKLVSKSKSDLLGRLPSSTDSIKTKGKIIYAYKKKREFSLKDDHLLKLNQRKIASLKLSVIKKKVRKFAPDYKKKSSVSIRIFGSVQKKFQKKLKHKTKFIKKRMPASVVKVKSRDITTHKPAFESSLTGEYKKQLRHSKGMNRLIRDLHSFDQDYKQSY